MRRYIIKNSNEVGRARIDATAGDLKLYKDEKNTNDFEMIKRRADKYKKWEKRNG